MVGIEAIADRLAAVSQTRPMDTGSRIAGSADVAPAAGADFKSVLSGLVSDTVGALRTSEATAISAIQGQASVQQVVETIMQAEQKMQVAVAVRDKVVAAYLEISRMPI